MKHPLIASICLAVAAASASDAPATPVDFPLRLGQFRVRDPFILADRPGGLYYLYAQTGNRLEAARRVPGVEVYLSRDLTNWSQPVLAFAKSDGFWGGREIWAPEVHHYGDDYLMFVSFNGREAGRGTQVLRAAGPTGPFELHGSEACTRPEDRCLDGTPWIESDGSRWMVYCHEWVQLGDGAMEALPMTADFRRRTGPPITLFTATAAPWVTSITSDLRPGNANFVTDGPCLYRTPSGRLLMLWSSFGREGYGVALAASDNGRIDGRWSHEPQPFYPANGGHCMLFRDFTGRLLLALHQPNGDRLERPRLFEVIEADDTLRLGPDVTP